MPERDDDQWEGCDVLDLLPTLAGHVPAVDGQNVHLLGSVRGHKHWHSTVHKKQYATIQSAIICTKNKNIRSKHILVNGTIYY